MTHPIRLVAAFFIGVLALSAFLSAARAGPALRAEVTVSRDTVLLGDLVSDAGALAATPVFRAPAPGLTGKISLDNILTAVGGAGLRDLATGGLTEVSVSRHGRAAGRQEIEAALRLALADQSRSPAPENIEISFDAAPLLTAETTSNASLTVTILSWNAKGRFEAEAVLGDSTQPAARQTITGHAIDGVEVVTALRSVPRARSLELSDLTTLRLPRVAVPADAVTRLDDAVGMAPRRGLRADEPLRSGELDKPLLVERGAVVTIIHRVPGMTLTVRGQALASGARGTTVSVLNSQSKRTIEGTVSGPGQITVSPAQAFVLSSR